MCHWVLVRGCQRLVSRFLWYTLFIGLFVLSFVSPSVAHSVSPTSCCEEARLLLSLDIVIVIALRPFESHTYGSHHSISASRTRKRSGKENKENNIRITLSISSLSLVFSIGSEMRQDKKDSYLDIVHRPLTPLLALSIYCYTRINYSWCRQIRVKILNGACPPQDG